MEIVFQYPFWIYFGCIVVGAAFSFLQYWRNKKLDSLTKTQLATLTVLRFLVVTVLSVLLVSPLIKYSKKQVEKPIVIIAQDNSESIALSEDSLYLMDSLQVELADVRQSLEEKYEIVDYTFGEDVNNLSLVNYNEKSTDLSKLLSALSNTYANRNVGALVLATDGINNRGSNPEYSELPAYPIYSVLLGDSTEKLDVSIKNIQHNSIAFLGNNFQILLGVKSNVLSKKTVKLKIFKESKVLKEKAIELNADVPFQEVSFDLEATKVGLQKYTLTIDAVEDEVNLKNNSKSFFIDVLEGKQKIVLVYDKLHPDISALRSAIESNKNYKVEVLNVSEFQEKSTLNSCDLLITYHLSSSENRTLIKEANTLKISRWCILNTENSTNTKLGLQNVVEYSSTKSSEETLAEINSNFSGFTLSTALNQFINACPPLESNSSLVKLMPKSKILLYKKIGNVKTTYPLFVLKENENIKHGVLIGEGLWRWKLSDFQKNGSHKLFNKFINKVVQYLSLKSDKSFFRLAHPAVVLEDEAVEFIAEVYNKSYELLDNAKVDLKLINDKEETFNFQFSPFGSKHKLPLQGLLAGDYHYEAKTIVDGITYKKEGVFTIQEIKLEYSDTRANHKLLNKLSESTNGASFQLRELSKLKKVLAENNEVKTVSYLEEYFSELISLKGIFYFLMICLTAEWFIRKYLGTY